MAQIDRSALFEKLNSIAYSSIESATAFCKLRGNRYVELAHWLHQIAHLQDSDLHHICDHFEIDQGQLIADISSHIDSLPRGASSVSDFSEDVLSAIERAWVVASLCFDATNIRTGALLVGVLDTGYLKRALFEISSEFKKVNQETLQEHYLEILKSSNESHLAHQNEGLNNESGAMSPASMGKNEALAQFAVNLTERVRAGETDPIVGRDDEVRQIVDILMRRRQNNPILTGEAGVGKTAVVEGLAQKVVSNDVPPQLKNVEIFALDIGLLQAGASMKGEFESRLRQVIEEVQSSEKPIILFIDEAHTLIGAGGDAGTGDAANLLKPALARGDLRTIAATTWAEYKKYIEKDPALTRRFQVVKIEEPTVEKAVQMMRGLAFVMEKHHQVQVLDESIVAAVELSHRYIPARQLPDKSISLLDTACARVAISQHAIPAEIDDRRKSVQALERELEIVQKEASFGENHTDRMSGIEEELVNTKLQERRLLSNWQAEKVVVEKILALRDKLQSYVENTKADFTSSNKDTVDVEMEVGADSKSVLMKKMQECQNELRQLQGDKPLIMPSVDSQAIASVVQDWTGIPVGKMVEDEIATIINLANIMGKRIIGQRHALEVIAKRIQTSRANLDNPQKPIGVFMLAGTSGVGKTETALSLAETLYGGEQNLITINMSEFQEAHTVSTLKGAPPGYVGYGEGGILTEAVRRKPHSVVLLDEIEKAHPDVHEIFFQVFDKGWMEDGEGRSIDFKNTVILLTTNAGTDVIADLCGGNTIFPTPDKIELALKEPLQAIFPPALLGRLVTVPYYPLSDKVIRQISKLQMQRIQNRIFDNHHIRLEYSEATISLIVERCTSVESGGRMIDTILTNTMLPVISMEILKNKGTATVIETIKIDVTDKEFKYDFG